MRSRTILTIAVASAAVVFGVVAPIVPCALTSVATCSVFVEHCDTLSSGSLTLVTFGTAER
jgi:hypothetical protein